ncbi:MAG: multicopper oxidase domain-containing protein [Spirochaetaceae bacterium]
MKTILLLSLSFFMINLYAGDILLPIPAVLNSSELELNIQTGELILPTGKTKTMGFNGNYLGPTIMVNRGDDLSFIVNNKLSVDTTVHWHGLLVPAEFDGGPHQIIKKKTTWNPKFKIIQPAATLWYHPHLMGKTAEHVYNGLAGMFYINDEYSKSLNIPQDYGINDFPIILQDRRVDNKGQFDYRPNMHENVFGYKGNVLLVNGAVEPKLKLDSGTYRFRILNGSNSSIFRVRFSDDKNFTVIASDGGFLPKTTSVKEIILSPGERYEILVDFDKDEKTSLMTDVYSGESFITLNILTSSNKGKKYNHPKKLDFEPVKYQVKSSTKRTFLMETGMMGRFTINGKSMSRNRIDFNVPRDKSEIWTIENVERGMMITPHSFHVHDVQFNVISVNGEKPNLLYSGPKDTILLFPGDVYEIALIFKEYDGIYMYHCHFLEHEDNGMMGQFMIE